MSPGDDSTAGTTSDKLTLKQGKDTLPKEGLRCRRLPTVKENTNRQRNKLVTKMKTPLEFYSSNQSFRLLPAQSLRNSSQ